MAHCFECNEPAAHAHHVIPRVKGGTQTVKLCERCHGLVHGLDFTNHAILVREGIRKRGPKLKITDGVKQRMRVLRAQDATVKEIAQMVGVTERAVYVTLYGE